MFGSNSTEFLSKLQKRYSYVLVITAGAGSITQIKATKSDGNELTMTVNLASSSTSGIVDAILCLLVTGMCKYISTSGANYTYYIYDCPFELSSMTFEGGHTNTLTAIANT